MQSEKIERTVTRLAELRSAGAVTRRLPADLAPATLADAYLVQDRFIAHWAKPVAGWKVGATAAPVQARFGVTEPFAGPVFAPDVLSSPARPPSARFPHHCIESELAFRVAAPLPASDAGYARSEVVDAIDAVLPAFELVGPRFEDLLFDAVPTAVADCALNAALVLGEPCLDWRRIDLPRLKVRLMVDGKVRAEGVGANVLGNPAIVLEWAVNHLCTRGIGLEPGQIISTGTLTGLVYLAPGETAVAEFNGLGSVEVCFSGPPHQRPLRPLG